MEDDLKFIQDTLQYVSDLICKWKSEAQEKIVKYEAMDKDIREKCADSFNRIFNVYAENIEKFEKKELELRKTITDILVKERDFIQTRTCAQGYKKELKSWKKR
jgi:hypothetical protein